MEQSLKDEILQLFEDEDKELTIVEKGLWVSDWKYETKETIVLYEGKHYCIDESRTGSYYSDYEYGDPIVYEVEPYEITVTKWKAK